MELFFHYRSNPEVICRQKGEHLLVTFTDLDDLKVYEFKNSSLFLWNILEVKMSGHNFKQEVFEKWPNITEEEWQTIDVFIDQLVELGLVIKSED